MVVPQLFHITQKAVFLQNGRILMLLRPGDPTNWEFPGGTLEPDEDRLAGLQREIVEELPGTRDLSIHSILDAQITGVRFGNARQMITYHDATADLSTAGLSDEHSQMRWVAANEIDKIAAEHILFPDTEAVARQVLA